MVRPVENDSQIIRLEEIGIGKMRQEFREKIMRVREKVHKETPPKMINGQPINGSVLASLIKSFV